MGPLESLAAWYSLNCNGTWEHQYGVEISTLDNPGWQVKIDLRGTRLDVVDGPRVEVTRSESDWVTCRVVDGQYRVFPEWSKYSLVRILDGINPRPT